ncbi:MAG: uL15 family ribosomal protein [Candidatus Micrarchaeales archaeon]|nr:uL15 family ribosomal protein [Candidatus Micrarchaeales archaeon]
MVVRRAKKNRKYLGTRRWGVGNIKNARGAGDRGGVGAIGRLRKHDWTYITAKRPDLIRKKGFTPRNRTELMEINLNQISSILKKQNKSELDLEGYKVLSNGTLDVKATIKASGFSEKAMEKIKDIGGSAVLIEQQGKAAPKPAAAVPASSGN